MNDEPITCIIPAGSNVLDVVRNICPSYFDDMKILLEAIKEISKKRLTNSEKYGIMYIAG